MRKVIRKFLIILFYLLRIFPIKKNKIVVVNYVGKGYGDNAKYIIEELLKIKKFDIVWLVKDIKDQSLPNGIRKVKFNSLKSFYELVTAKVWIDNCRKMNYVRKRKNQFYIQTWHGIIGYKKTEKSAIDALPDFYIKNAINDSKMADLFISSNKYMTELYRRDYWYNGEILECGYPRNDVIVNNNEDAIVKVRNYFNISEKNKIVIYAPTFRKNGSLNSYNLDYNKLIEALKKKYKENFIVLIRLHPNISNSSNLIYYNEVIKNATNYPDMQELMVAADILITDYSSCIFDFALSNKPAFIYASDIEDYCKDRDFELEFSQTPFSVSTCNDELINAILTFDNVKYQKKVSNFYKKIGSKENGNASKIIANYITNYVKNGKNENIKKENKTLFFNTAMLYLMQVATFVFPLLTFPYLTRTLGAENYGIVVFANAVMVYFQLFIDFGFLLSGTEKCSNDRHNINKLSQITTSIICGKLILSFIGLIAIIMVILLIDSFKGKELYVLLSYLPLILTAFIPDYLFRGIEKMGIITSRTIVSKIFYTLLIFLFVKKPHDYYYIALATFISNLITVLWSWKYIKKEIGVKLIKLNFNDVFKELKSSSIFFASRIATTIYSASNVFILGIYGYNDISMGLYGSANNLITYGRGVFSPIADSIYPYMIKNKNYKLVNKILYILMPLILMGCIILYFISDFVIGLMCGNEYLESVGLFRRMIPLLAITLPSYLYGFPMLGAIGKNDKANLSVIVGAIFHIMGLFVLFTTKTLNFVNIIYLTIITEIIILVLRIIFFNKYKPKKEKEQNEKSFNIRNI